GSMGHSPPGFARQLRWCSPALPATAKSVEEAIARTAIVDLMSFMISAFKTYASGQKGKRYF
ncbi:MAG: hypothetical protein WCC96_14645, partial [Rhodomicrobium sp.]